MFHKSTYVHFQKIHFKKKSRKTYEIFLGGKHPKNGEEGKTLSRLLLSLLLEMGKV